MNLTVPQDYRLNLEAGTYSLSSNKRVCNFTAPASTPKLPKLYAVYDSNALHYIGVTRQPMAVRLRHGLTANGKNGYHGYKWKQNLELYLSIWTLEGCAAEEAREMLETIEAEVVFLYRKRYKRWPESQHEIHFHNNAKLGWRIPDEIIRHIADKLQIK